MSTYIQTDEKPKLKETVIKSSALLRQKSPLHVSYWRSGTKYLAIVSLLTVLIRNFINS